MKTFKFFHGINFQRAIAVISYDISDFNDWKIENDFGQFTNDWYNGFERNNTRYICVMNSYGWYSFTGIVVTNRTRLRMEPELIDQIIRSLL